MAAPVRGSQLPWTGALRTDGHLKSPWMLRQAGVKCLRAVCRSKAVSLASSFSKKTGAF